MRGRGGGGERLVGGTRTKRTRMHDWKTVAMDAVLARRLGVDISTIEIQPMYGGVCLAQLHRDGRGEDKKRSMTKGSVPMGPRVLA